MQDTPLSLRKKHDETDTHWHCQLTLLCSHLLMYFGKVANSSNSGSASPLAEVMCGGLATIAVLGSFVDAASERGYGQGPCAVALGNTCRLNQTYSIYMYRLTSCFYVWQLCIHSTNKTTITVLHQHDVFFRVVGPMILLADVRQRYLIRYLIAYVYHWPRPLPRHCCCGASDSSESWQVVVPRDGAPDDRCCFLSISSSKWVIAKWWEGVQAKARSWRWCFTRKAHGIAWINMW